MTSEDLLQQGVTPKPIQPEIVVSKSFNIGNIITAVKKLLHMDKHPNGTDILDEE